MTKKQLEKLHKKLPKNGVFLLSQKTGFSYEYVRLILSGERNNPQILKAAIELAEKHQKELQEIQSKINAL